MTFRRARVRAAIGFIAWLALQPAPAAAQDSIGEAKKLYQLADYEAALGVLDRLKTDPKASADADIAAYRVFCLLALGRGTDAHEGIAAILRQDPHYRPSETDTSPRIRAVFEEARRRLLPQIIQERYDAAKTAYERKEFQSAADQFKALLPILDDPTLAGEDSRTELRLVISGFADLARAAAATRVQSPAGPPAALPASPPTAAAAAPPRVYAAGTPGVVPPVAISKPLPPLPRGDAIVVRREYVGTLELTIDPQGKVSEVVIKKGIHPQFDGRLVNTVRSWKFRPATKDGQPVSYRTVLDIKLVP